jgi:hypothetical protein
MAATASLVRSENNQRENKWRNGGVIGSVMAQRNENQRGIASWQRRHKLAKYGISAAIWQHQHHNSQRQKPQNNGENMWHQ